MIAVKPKVQFSNVGYFEKMETNPLNTKTVRCPSLRRAIPFDTPRRNPLGPVV